MNKRDLTLLYDTVKSFRNKKIAVVGDLMLDAYTWGKVNRISPEAPVPIVQVIKRTQCLGGAANVMRNIISLGAQAAAFGVIGDDVNGQNLRELLDEAHVDTCGIFIDPARPTTFKERIIAGSQQLLRLDDEKQTAVLPQIKRKLFERFSTYLKEEKPDAVILEDYAKGLFSKENAQHIVNLCQEEGIPVTLDPKPSNPLYLKGLTVMKPNRAEAFALAGMTPPLDKTDINSLKRAARKIRKDWNVKYLLISLAEEGMALIHRNGSCKVIPTRAREVFDVSGAGDTVIATVTLALCTSQDPELSAEIANYAAGVVVGKLGTATVSVEELRKSFSELC